MPLFWKPYTSDVTAFIDELKAKKPTLEDEQRRGRSICSGTAASTASAEAEYDEAQRAAAALRLPDRAALSARRSGSRSSKPIAEARRSTRAMRSTASPSRGSTASRCSTLPQDLYIPPDALEVFLEAFEGPLDLLLYLIRQAELQHPRHPAGERDAPVPGLRRADPHAQPRARQPTTC